MKKGGGQAGDAGGVRERLVGIVDRMATTPVLLVADLVLDVFEHGRIGRISREAPVLILDQVRTDRLPGGGANVGANLAALGARTDIVGRVGADAAGEALVDALARLGCSTAGIVRDPGYRTPEKRRILAGSAHSVQQQIVRLDSGGGAKAAAADLVARLSAAAGPARGVVFSDYSLGLFHDDSIEPLLAAAREAQRPVFVDSRTQLRRFHGVAAATPNLQEAETALGGPIGGDPERLHAAAEAIRARLDAETVVVTLGSLGMAVAGRSGARARLAVYGTDEVADVTGAGDTVIATLALAILAGAEAVEAALLANYAGGIVVMKRGTATVSPDELRQAVRRDAQLDARLEGR
ncbi:MAG TPA: PfkB family carbohydrate kinase [Candidatus Polarisedimenticolia bacterium]|jgi:rfaE bifunctional protein kinase chain/domain|nr:PfkB family carbohydrate kinase [Candidatus Polarisedimenticolia bacterium]